MNKAKIQVNINPEVSADAVILPNGDTIKKGEIASMSESDWKKVQNKKNSGLDLLVIAGLPLLIEDSSDEEE